MALSPEAEGYGFAWGAIQSGVAAHADTASIFAAVRDEIDRLGIAAPPGMWAAVNELRGVAVAQRRGAVTFNRAADEAAFTPAMAPADINARTSATAALFPEYRVRFDMTQVNPDGTTSTVTRTMRDTWLPDMTVGDVREAVTASAEGMAADYGVTLVSFSNLRPVGI